MVTSKWIDLCDLCSRQSAVYNSIQIDYIYIYSVFVTSKDVCVAAFATSAKFSAFACDSMVYKAKKIYYLVLVIKRLLVPDQSILGPWA